MSTQFNPVIWFEIPVTDLDRAKRFYEAVLEIGLAPPADVAGNTICFFPMEMNRPGAGGALIRNEHVEPSQQGTTIYFSVGQIDPVVRRITAAGGKVCLPRTSIGQYGFIAHFLDTEGNRVALHEPPQR